MSDLKPCPFCGGTAHGYVEKSTLAENTVLHFVQCLTCGATTDKYLTAGIARDKWNHRADSQNVYCYKDHKERTTKMTYQELSEKFVDLSDSYYELMSSFDRLTAEYGRVGTEIVKFAILLNKASREEDSQ